MIAFEFEEQWEVSVQTNIFKPSQTVLGYINVWKVCNIFARIGDIYQRMKFRLVDSRKHYQTESQILIKVANCNTARRVRLPNLVNQRPTVNFPVPEFEARAAGKKIRKVYI